MLIVINSLGSSCWCNKSQNYSIAQGLNEQNVCTINSWTEDGSMWQVIGHCILLKKNCLCYRHAERRIEHYLYFIAAHTGMFYSWNTVNVSRGAHILSNSLLVVVFVTYRLFYYSLSFYALFSLTLFTRLCPVRPVKAPYVQKSLF